MTNTWCSINLTNVCFAFARRAQARGRVAGKGGGADAGGNIYNRWICKYLLNTRVKGMVIGDDLHDPASSTVGAKYRVSGLDNR